MTNKTGSILPSPSRNIYANDIPPPRPSGGEHVKTVLVFAFPPRHQRGKRDFLVLIRHRSGRKRFFCVSGDTGRGKKDSLSFVIAMTPPTDTDGRHITQSLPLHIRDCGFFPVYNGQMPNRTRTTTNTLCNRCHLPILPSTLGTRHFDS